MADILPALGIGAAWVVTVCLLLAGFIGTLVPFLPGHLIIFMAAVAHWLMLREDSGVEWWTFTVLAVLLIVSQALEFLSGAMGICIRHSGWSDYQNDRRCRDGNLVCGGCNLDLIRKQKTGEG